MDYPYNAKIKNEKLSKNMIWLALENPFFSKLYAFPDNFEDRSRFPMTVGIYWII